MPYLIVVEKPSLREIENVFIAKTEDDLNERLADLKSAIFIVIDLSEVDYSYAHYDEGGLPR